MIRKNIGPIDYLVFIFIPVILFVLFRCHLDDLLWGDEIFPYMDSVYYMINTKISLLPQDLPEDIFKGHPVLFPALFAILIKYFELEIESIRFLTLGVTCASIYCLWYLIRNYTSEIFAAIAVLLFLSNPALSGYALAFVPETLFILCNLLSIIYLIKRRYLLFIIFCNLLVMIKITGVIFPISILVSTIFSFYMGIISKEEVMKYLKVVFYGSFSFIVFFTLQKLDKGWFFYPYHIELTSFKDNFLISLGQSIFLLVYSLNILLFFIYRKSSIMNFEKILFIFITLGYFSFNTLYFLVPRYLIPLNYFIFILCLIQLFDAVKKDHVKMSFIVCSLFITILIKNSLSKSLDLEFFSQNHYKRTELYKSFTDRIMQLNLKEAKVCIDDWVYKVAVSNHRYGYFNSPYDVNLYNNSNCDDPDYLIVSDMSITNSDIFEHLASKSGGKYISFEKKDLDLLDFEVLREESGKNWIKLLKIK